MWNALLDGAQRDAALATVREIAAALAEPPPCHRLADDSESAARVANATLSLGHAGTALSLGYLSLVHDEPSYAANARTLIASAASVLGKEVMRPTLYGGFVGIAWALAKLRAWGVVAATDASFAAIDRALVTWVGQEDWPHPVELIYGLAGCLVYALARLPGADAQRVIERALHALEVSAEATADGLTWFVDPMHLRSTTLERAPEGCYNLGLSHGNPGVISILAEIHRLGVDPPRTRRLLEESVRWVLAQELEGGRFPSLTGPGVNAKPARVAWCYGPPGVAIALLRAAQALGREDWHAHAVRIATLAAKTPPDDTGVVDPPFCHGAVGLMHVYNRLYQETGVKTFADAARGWFDRTLEYRREGIGIAGFGARLFVGPEHYGEPGMLYGVAGIAASFAAAISDREPSWDAMFALSDAGTA
jgi:lantibiotic modifying enzyme